MALAALGTWTGKSWSSWGRGEQGSKIWGSEECIGPRWRGGEGFAALQAGLGDATTRFSCFAGERTALILEEAAGQGQRQEETWQALDLYTEAARAVTLHRPPRSKPPLLRPGKNAQQRQSHYSNLELRLGPSGCFQLESLPGPPVSWKCRKSGSELLKQSHFRFAGGKKQVCQNWRMRGVVIPGGIPASQARCWRGGS